MESKSLWGDLDPEVEALLKDPALLYRIKCELDRFIVGEDKNKLLLFLIAASSYTKWPLSAIITGESSAGKSWLMNNVLRFFDNIEEFTRITAAAPDRLGQDFTNRILKVEELRGTDQAQATLRVWISEGRLRLLTTSPDTKEAEVIETKGVPTFITTCTDVNVDTELLNRVFFLSVDESKEQTKRVLEFEAQEYSILGVQNYKEVNPLFKKIFQPLIYVDKVIIPYAHILAKNFPIPETRELAVKPRRDFKKLLFLIGTIAWLHQMQRIIVEEESIPKIRYVVASPVDFVLAWQICEEGMKATLLNLSDRHRGVLEVFNENEQLTAREVAEKTGYSQNRAREILNSLVKYGFLYRDEKEKPYKYGLRKKAEIPHTSDMFVQEIVSFYQEKLEEALTGMHENTKIVRIYEPSHPWSLYVDPLTGKQYDLLNRSDFVFSCLPTEEARSSSKQETAEQNTRQPFVSETHKSEEIKALFWVDGEFTFHPCGICGYSKLTSWKAETFNGQQFWICEDCKEEWEKQRKVE
ncbi:hypothetical protein DRP04_09055 [Archaeoglobales archaeon]|nr:MAG: hypothetical protein DRP04_09055 [Archaeoglobales archaeon]